MKKREKLSLIYFGFSIGVTLFNLLNSIKLSNVSLKSLSMPDFEKSTMNLTPSTSIISKEPVH